VTPLDDIDRLVQLVRTRTDLFSEEEHKAVRELDIAISAKCHLLQVPMPSCDVKGLRCFGFVRVPYQICVNGWRFVGTANWHQAIQSLRAMVVAKLQTSIEANDRAKARSQQQIVEYAKEHFSEAPDERSIRNWIANGSLRAFQRGVLWEFSHSDLQALVVGRSK
jgi:hypothetical protein